MFRPGILQNLTKMDVLFLWVLVLLVRLWISPSSHPNDTKRLFRCRFIPSPRWVWRKSFRNPAHLCTTRIFRRIVFINNIGLFPPNPNSKHHVFQGSPHKPQSLRPHSRSHTRSTIHWWLLEIHCSHWKHEQDQTGWSQETPRCAPFENWKASHRWSVQLYSSRTSRFSPIEWDKWNCNHRVSTRSGHDESVWEIYNASNYSWYRIREFCWKILMYTVSFTREQYAGWFKYSDDVYATHQLHISLIFGWNRTSLTDISNSRLKPSFCASSDGNSL